MPDAPPAASAAAAPPPPCLVCRAQPIAYECVPCGHPTLCGRCAMKQASGGKCKVCKELFGELRRLRGVGGRAGKGRWWP